MNEAVLLLVVSLAGGVGSACRYLVDAGIRGRWPTTVPWSTLVINVSASLLLGLLAGSLGGTDALTVAGTGFCGGYSTFSTAAVDLVRLLAAGERRGSALYAAGTLLLPVLAAALGYGLTG